MSATVVDLAALRERWAAAWPEALAAWGPYTRLHAPVLHTTPRGEGSFAWFSTVDVEVQIDLALVAALGIGGFAREALAHEVGHHVLAPGDLRRSAATRARVAVGLGEKDARAGTVANVWNDLLVNDRLQRRAGLDMVGLWRALPRPLDADFQLVMRTYEILWGTGPGVLTNPALAVPEREALLCSRLVRTYADDPVGGAAGFALLIAPFLPEDDATGGQRVVCAQHEPAGSLPAGLATDASLGLPAVHPAVDPRVVGAEPGDEPGDEPESAPDDGVPLGTGAADTGLSTIGPASYDAVLRGLGLTGSLAESTRAWYRENAAPHLVPFPDRAAAPAVEPLLGTLDPWELGDDLGDVDWGATIARSPVVVPGFTTVQRAYDEQPGPEPDRTPVDLDIYLDSSGSMPDPTRRRAPVALAGAVLALSALRAGARVQATTWSGADQIAGTDGFTRDPTAVLDAIVAHFGGGTAFPVPLLERTHLGDPRTGAPPTRTGPCHIAVVSDLGIMSMVPEIPLWTNPVHPVETVPPEGTLAARALAAAGGGGSLVLQADEHSLDRVRAMLPGYDVYAVTDDADLVRFTAEFAARLWGSRR